MLHTKDWLNGKESWSMVADWIQRSAGLIYLAMVKSRDLLSVK